MIEKLYTVEEVAELASVTGRTIRNYLKSGRLVGRKIGGQWRFPESEVQRLLTGAPPERAEELEEAPAIVASQPEPEDEPEPPVFEPDLAYTPSTVKYPAPAAAEPVKEPEPAAPARAQQEDYTSPLYAAPPPPPPAPDLTAAHSYTQPQQAKAPAHTPQQNAPVVQPPQAPRYPGYIEPTPLPGTGAPPPPSREPVHAQEPAPYSPAPQQEPAPYAPQTYGAQSWEQPGQGYAQTQPPQQNQPYAPLAGQPYPAAPEYPAPETGFVPGYSPVQQGYAPANAPVAPVYPEPTGREVASVGVIGQAGQPGYFPAPPQSPPPYAGEAPTPKKPPVQEPAKKESPQNPALSEVGALVTEFITEVHDCSQGPRICTVIELNQPLEAAKITIARLADFAMAEADSGIPCHSYLEYDERYYVARYTLFGSSGFLLRCLQLIG